MMYILQVITQKQVMVKLPLTIGMLGQLVHMVTLRLEVCPSATAYEQDLGVGNLVNGAGAVGDTTITVDDADASGFAFQVGDMIKFHTNDSVTATSNGASTASINLTVDANSGTSQLVCELLQQELMKWSRLKLLLLKLLLF